MEKPASATPSHRSSLSQSIKNSPDIDMLIHRGNKGYGVNSFPDSSNSSVSSSAADEIDGTEDCFAESSLFSSVTSDNMQRMPDDETMRDDVANQNNEAQQRPGTMGRGYQLALDRPAELQSNLDITKETKEQKHEIMELKNKSDELQASNEKIKALTSENTTLRSQNAFLLSGYYTMKLQNEQQRKDFQLACHFASMLQYLVNEGQRQRIVQLSSQNEQLLLSFGKNMQKMADVETMRDFLAKQNTELQHRVDALERGLQEEKRTRLLPRDAIKDLTDNKKIEQDSLKCQAVENNENSLKMVNAEMMSGFLEKQNELQERADKFKRKYQLAHEKTNELQAELHKGKEKNKQQCDEIRDLIKKCKEFEEYRKKDLETISNLATSQLALNVQKSELCQLLESATEELQQCRKELDDIKTRKGRRTTFMSRVRRCLSRVKVSSSTKEPRISQPIERPGQRLTYPADDYPLLFQVPSMNDMDKSLAHYCSQEEDDFTFKLPVCYNTIETTPFVPLKRATFKLGSFSTLESDTAFSVCSP